nr:FG-GAP repeat protein [Planctomycetota bacterium]
MPGKGLEMKILITSLVVCVLSGGVFAQTPVNEDFKLLASDGASDDYFGLSVAVSGDTVVVGAYGDDDNGFYTGSAYVYRFDGSSWIETKLLASDG